MVRNSATFGPDWNISTTIGGIALKLGSDIHGPQKIKTTDFGYLMTLNVNIKLTFVIFSVMTKKLLNGLPHTCHIYKYSPWH